MHNLSGLADLKSQLEDSINSDFDINVSKKCRHFQVLLDFLNSHAHRTVAPAKKRLHKDSPTVVFSDIWFLLAPGKISYFIYDGIRLDGIIKSVEYKEGDLETKEHWSVKVLVQDVAFRMKAFTAPSPVIIQIESFVGEKFVTSLPVFPREYHDTKDNGKRKAAFERRGDFAADLLWASYKYVKYDGEVRNVGNYISGRVYRKGIKSTPSQFTGPMVVGICDNFDQNIYGEEWEFAPEPEDEMVDKADSPAGFVLPMRLVIEKSSKESLTADHRFMMLPMVPGFALSTKTWGETPVDTSTDASIC